MANFQIPVLQRHIDAATQTDGGTSLMLAILDPLTGVPNAISAEMGVLGTLVNIDGTSYNLDYYALVVQTAERGLGIKPLGPYVASLTYASGPLGPIIP